MEKTEINNVQFAEEPQAILYMPLPSGEADVFLRRNIRQETDGEGIEIWTAEEAQFRTVKTRDEVMKNFDSYFTPQLTTGHNRDSAIRQAGIRLGNYKCRQSGSKKRICCAGKPSWHTGQSDHIL